ncbi:MAG: carboxypeptidase regulatory-like domain-containing protein [Chloroflexi bacterium]|nr:carboxypeptidase regulatory-like domain-containing protein [Chloroflexota bacterium]
MSYVNSPKVEYTPDGRPPERKDWRHLSIRLGILFIFILGLALNLYAFKAGNLVNLAAGTNGVAQGIILDTQGQPIPNATIALASAPEARTSTQADGSFTLENIPTGDQYLIVVHNGIGEGFVVAIQPAGVTQIGTLSYEAKPAVWN